MTRRIKICRVVTVPQTFRMLLREQLHCAAESGLELTLVSSPGPELEELAAELRARAVGIPIRRNPAPVADLVSLLRLSRFYSANRFDIVHSSTPKAGLLSGVASVLAGVPVRVHTFTGQPWVELSGVRRAIPRVCDRITAYCATQCYADSPSQRNFLVSEGIVAAKKLKVIGAGSISGVDLDRFSTDRWGGDLARKTRLELGIPTHAEVIIFVGRITKDKGIRELRRAFESVAASNPQVHLLLVGPMEADQKHTTRGELEWQAGAQRTHFVGYTTTPEKYLAASDIFCLPSYREGFGSVVVEAAAMGLPVVVTRVTGLIDSVVEGRTGLVVPPKDVGQLSNALTTLLDSRDLRKSLGDAGRLRVRQEFDAKLINGAVVAEYNGLFGGGLTLPGSQR
jgi:glycosyltransferase involved in cell wall biosynthesis